MASKPMYQVFMNVSLSRLCRPMLRCSNIMCSISAGMALSVESMRASRECHTCAFVTTAATLGPL